MSSEAIDAVEVAQPRPRPRIDPDSTEFWRAAAAGQLMLARCSKCGRWEHPPREACTVCGGPMVMERSDGVGTVYSYIVVHHNTIPGFSDLLPYAIALVDFEGGCRLPARVVGEPDRDSLIGSTVRVEFEQLADDTVPALLVRVEEQGAGALPSDAP
jgi:uncharacterized OB-fold protein